MKIPGDLTPTERGFLFDPYTGCTYTLNKTGHFIFKKLQESMSIQEVAKIVANEYKPDTEQSSAEWEKKVLEDVKNFVEDIKSFGLEKK